MGPKRSRVPGEDDDTTKFPPDEEEMEEVPGEELPEPFKFEVVGDSLSGRYLKQGEHDGEFKKQTTYLIEANDGKRYTVFGNADLNERMRKVATGARVSIEYMGDEPMPRGMNPRRIFKVKASKGVASRDASAATSREPRKV